MYQRYGKRLLDLIAASVGLMLAVPILVLLMLALALTYSGNPFFLQIRPGWQGRPFQLIKFKTMTDQRDATGQLREDAERLTPLGRFIRKTSLDELPQLWHVLVGEMSLVGPRPLLVDYWPLYTPGQRRRHSVRPGITGWAQVNGRNAISWETKFACDNWYVDHISLQMDLKIIGLTIGKVCRAEAVTGDGTRFTGTHS